MLSSIFQNMWAPMESPEGDASDVPESMWPPTHAPDDVSTNENRWGEWRDDWAHTSANQESPPEPGFEAGPPNTGSQVQPNLPQRSLRADTSVPPLTFGIEIEFLIARISGDDKIDPHPNLPQSARDLFNPRIDDSDVREWISVFLRKNGIGCQPPRYNGPNVPAWLTQYDPTITPPHFRVKGKKDDPYTWHGIEIASPPYVYNNTAIYHISRTLSLLTSNYRCHTNASCGLHLHVGMGDNPLPFHALKRLMTFLWTFDPVLASGIHEPHRTNRKHLGTAYCSPVRNTNSSGIAQDMANQGSLYYDPGFGPEKKKLVRPSLARIMGAETYNELFELFHNGNDGQKYVAYNLTGLNIAGSEWDQRPGRLTIEFRQHASTLDQRRVIAWVKTIIGIVDWCRRVDGKTFYGTISQQAKLEEENFKIGKNGRWDLRGMLNCVGVEEGVIDFYEKHSREFQTQKPHNTYAWREDNEWDDGSSAEPSPVHSPEAEWAMFPPTRHLPPTLVTPSQSRFPIESRSPSPPDEAPGTGGSATLFDGPNAAWESPDDFGTSPLLPKGEANPYDEDTPYDGPSDTKPKVPPIFNDPVPDEEGEWSGAPVRGSPLLGKFWGGASP